MKKSAILMVLFGIIVLTGIYYFTKPKPTTSTQTQTQLQVQTPVIVSVNYDSTKPFTPQTYTVIEGQQVKLQVTSDLADELHFHGYDLHTDLTSGKQGEIDFTADKTGRFEFELESRSYTLGVIEVDPK